MIIPLAATELAVRFDFLRSTCSSLNLDGTATRLLGCEGTSGEDGRHLVTRNSNHDATGAGDCAAEGYARDANCQEYRNLLKEVTHPRAHADECPALALVSPRGLGCGTDDERMLRPAPSAPVTVVVPCYNCGAAIRHAVATVLTQTWCPAEVIVVDDGSTDAVTRAVLQQLVREHASQGLRVIARDTNAGPGIARNTGWDAATQPYIAFLDADDSWHSKKVEVQLQYMLDHPRVHFTAHRWRITRRDKWAEPVAISRVRARRVGKWGMLLRNSIATSTVMLRRDVPLRFPAKRFSEDYLLWLSLLFEGFEGHLLEIPLASRHKPPFGAGGLSGNLWGMELGELDTYRQIADRGYIPRWALVALIPYSLGKSARRVALTLLRRAVVVVGG